MGFFNALGKVLAGKPVFEPQQGGSTAAPTQQPAGPIQQTAAGPKHIPELHLGRVECQVNGERMDVYVDIANRSAEPIFLDDITVLGMRRELQRQLKPGEGRQQFVFSGQRLTNQPSGYAELRFRKVSDGDYFLNYYRYDCTQQRDGGYIIGLFRPTGPTKDV